MERDDELGAMFDAADDQGLQAMDYLARERESEEALEACLKAGVSREHLKILARETGCFSWALRQSLKG